MASTARLGGARRNQNRSGAAVRGRPGDRTASADAPEDGVAIIHHLQDFIDAFMWQADAQTLEITFATKTAFQVTGVSADEWTGPVRQWLAHTYPGDRGHVEGALRAVAASGVDRDIECRVMTPSGTERHLRHSVRRLESPTGEPELWGITVDRTSEIQTEKALEETRVRYHRLSEEADEFRRRSLSDPLTQLPNRVLFQDRLATMLHAAARMGVSTAVLLIDLDRFKELNDTMGHMAGDIALKEFALRFRICLRAQDTPARLGGDEFAAVLPNTDAAGAMGVADRIVRGLSDPATIDGVDVRLRASIGVALAPVHGANPDDLMAAADAAMYRAKATSGSVAIADERDVHRSGDATIGHGHRRRLVRSVLGLAAVMAVLAGAAVPLAHRVITRHDPARSISAAAVALKQPAADVSTVVDRVSATLSQISAADSSGDDLTVALAALANALRRIRPEVRADIAERIDRTLVKVDDVRTRTQSPAAPVVDVRPLPEPSAMQTAAVPTVTP